MEHIYILNFDDEEINIIANNDQEAIKQVEELINHGKINLPCVLTDRLTKPGEPIIREIQRW